MKILNGMPVLSGQRDFGFEIAVDCEAGDLMCPNSLARHRDDGSWFGGPADKEDDGNTASGTPDHVYGVMGCSLPMDWPGHWAATAGSPIPKLPWQILVRVYCQSTAKTIEVPLIDVGPSFGTDHAIDLTEAAFNALGISLEQGLTAVDFRIMGGAKYLPDEVKAALRDAGFTLP